MGTLTRIVSNCYSDFDVIYACVVLRLELRSMGFPDEVLQEAVTRMASRSVGDMFGIWVGICALLDLFSPS